MKASFHKSRLVRDLDNAIISGLCAGVAKQAGIDTVWVRVAAVAGLIMVPQLFLLGYVAGVILVPKS